MRPAYEQKNPTISNVKSLDLWSEWRESNSRPLEPHSSALPKLRYTRISTAASLPKRGDKRYYTQARPFCQQIFRLFLFGPSGENRTHGLLNPIVLLSKTQCTIRYCLDSVSLNFKCIISFCFIGCQDVSFLLWSNCGQTTPTNDFSPPAKLHRAISIFTNRSCAFCLHELSIRRICQPCQ